MPTSESLELMGVPMVIRPPANPNLSAPLIILWHGFGTPHSEQMLAETLPLDDVQAWKVYPELPLFGTLMKTGSVDELLRRQFEDYILNMMLPVTEQVVQVLPNLVQALRSRLNIQDDRLGLFGFSAGGLSTLLTLLESPLPIQAAVLVGVIKNIESAVSEVERLTQESYSMLKEQFSWIEERHKTYHWTEASEAAKSRLDFVARASEIAQHQPMPAILLVHGAQDEIYPVSKVEELYRVFAPYYEQAHQPERLCLRTFEHLGHQLDLEAAKQAAKLQQDLSELQQVIATWFSQHLN